MVRLGVVSRSPSAVTSGVGTAISIAPRSWQMRAITFHASPPIGTPVTHGTPGLMMPAFSAAISPKVSPKSSVWSSPMFVMTVISGCETTFVASRRPPRPTSSTT